MTEPSFVPLQAAGQLQQGVEQDRDGGLTPYFANMGLCGSCQVVRPLRSKHCNACKRWAALGPWFPGHFLSFWTRVQSSGLWATSAVQALQCLHMESFSQVWESGMHVQG